MNTPIDVTTVETIHFLTPHLQGRKDILEVGCGGGEVARALDSLGFQVLGLDQDAESVKRARERGVVARQAAWPDYQGDTVDAVLFTRSLHHIRPLDGALRRARELLRPDGLLLVEDFAYDAIDARTLEWLRRAIDAGRAESLIVDVPGALAIDLWRSETPTQMWRAHHAGHGVHEDAELSQAIEREFTVDFSVVGAYLYRYLVHLLPQNVAAASFLARIQKEESTLGTKGAIALIGRRFVGTPRRST